MNNTRKNDKLWFFIIPTLLSILIVATAIIYWTIGRDLDERHDNTTPQQEATAAASTTPQPSATPVGNDNTNCDDLIVTQEDGREHLPKTEKYSHLNALGELFTAAESKRDCTRFITGITDNQLTQGLRIDLKEAPEGDLLQIFLNNGFTCDQGNFDRACTSWSKEQPIPVSEVLKLKPFADSIVRDDCINCG